MQNRTEIDITSTQRRKKKLLKTCLISRFNDEYSREVFKSIKERTCKCQKCHFYVSLNPRRTRNGIIHKCKKLTFIICRISYYYNGDINFELRNFCFCVCC